MGAKYVETSLSETAERRERDSNPRWGFKPHTRLAGERLQPLGHLSLDVVPLRRHRKTGSLFDKVFFLRSTLPRKLDRLYPKPPPLSTLFFHLTHNTRKLHCFFSSPSLRSSPLFPCRTQPRSTRLTFLGALGYSERAVCGLKPPCASRPSPRKDGQFRK